MIAGQDPTEEGNQSCPGIGGGHNWQATAYSPRTNLYYCTSTDGCQIYYKTKQEFIEGQWYQGSTAQGLPTADIFSEGTRKVGTREMGDAVVAAVTKKTITKG